MWNNQRGISQKASRCQKRQRPSPHQRKTWITTFGVKVTKKALGKIVTGIWNLVSFSQQPLTYLWGIWGANAGIEDETDEEEQEE